MSDTPKDIKIAARECVNASFGDPLSPMAWYVERALLSERARCMKIAQSIDPHNEAEAHLIETIVRKMRGDE